MTRLEGLYLANLDASLFDQMLSELPIRSSDTLLILESLHKHFRDLQAALKHLEVELKNRNDVAYRQSARGALFSRKSRRLSDRSMVVSMTTPPAGI